MGKIDDYSLNIVMGLISLNYYNNRTVIKYGLNKVRVLIIIINKLINFDYCDIENK
jgi:hypothetical protein